MIVLFRKIIRKALIAIEYRKNLIDKINYM